MAAQKSVKKSKKRGAVVKRARRSGGAGAADRSLRDHVLYLLRGGGAHLDFDKAIADLPSEQRGLKAAGLPFTAWRLLEHMRIAQWDILEFSRDAKHTSPAWPEGYWPPSDAPQSAGEWDRSVAAFQSDRKALERLVDNPKTDLHARIPHGEGQTILREALLVADHNAYHLGQLVILRRLLGSWHD
ncbi:MAG TPA: DinB family protein [Terriglobia bacterium]|nr:DinB family protein [Terriglobia bacterium]